MFFDLFQMLPNLWQDRNKNNYINNKNMAITEKNIFIL